MRLQIGRSGAAAGSTRGLTLVEVLVAMTLLGIVSVALVGSFSLLASVNRDSSVDVDMSRVVRSVTEKIVDDWDDFDNFDNELVSGYSIHEYVDQATSQRCDVSVTSPDIESVKLVALTCEAGGDVGEQSYYVEVGDPEP